MTVELPRWVLADRLVLALGLATGIVLEAILAGYPAAPAGVGLAVAAVLASWHLYQQRLRPRALELSPPAGTLWLEDGRSLPFTLGPGSRVLGPTVVLHWQAVGRSGALWLTPLDLPREVLRTLAVRLAASGRPAGR
jgi:hypothetical protein